MNHIAIFASAHAPLYIGLPIIAVVVVLKLVVSRARGGLAFAREVTVRCNRGHVFTTTWSSLGSLTSIRLGYGRLMRCPVGHHWALVRLANTDDHPTIER